MNLAEGLPFDAVPFGQPLPDGNGWRWEDQRELHRVVLTFRETPPETISLQYWLTSWPHRRLPKDHVPEGGRVGWWGLGDWFRGRWQTADTSLLLEDNKAIFSFRPLNEREFPDMVDLPVTYRTTLQIRWFAKELPPLERVEAYTDSVWRSTTLTVLWRSIPSSTPIFEAFNGYVSSARMVNPRCHRVTLWRTHNPDPNSFDKTLLTVRGDSIFTVAIEDLDVGPLYLPDHGVCLVKGEERRDFAGVVASIRVNSPPSLYDLISELPEQNWGRAWRNMVPKRGWLYLPLGTDGGRHKFGVNSDGSVFYRTNNRYLIRRPGRDTPRLQSDRAEMKISFGLPSEPVVRGLQEDTLPIGITVWEVEGVKVEQIACATVLDGIDPQGPPPAGDAIGILLLRFTFTNITDEPLPARLPIRFTAEGEVEELNVDERGWIWSGDKRRVYVEVGGRGDIIRENGLVSYHLELPPGTSHTIVLKLPYVALSDDEAGRCEALEFEAERRGVAEYWRRRLDEGTRLITPEPMLNEFYRAHAAHLLINCEREPNSEVRFARVGSFRYGVYGNESCMMIVDLDRRGYHREARECLEAFLKYQGTVPLPGDYSSKEGVLYGVGGYEAGGYNQHHGWIMWCLVEHYRFTGDEDWLRRIAPNLIAASDWIIRERRRTKDRDDIGRGLLPHGSLEDITDWWQWLSTNAYSWRGLDAAAWALERTDHPEAARIRREADDYRQSILRSFREAAQRSPVVRLRDNTCLPHFPSHPHRRGRSFGWIREVLEGAIHLLIAGLIDSNSPEALWILKDYEDNLFLSPHYGYRIEDFERHWFDRGGFSLQACLLLDAEPYLYRDDVKHALRAIFNAIAAYYFPDTQMLTEHALVLGEWRGDHYKSSDEANAAGWLRYLFLREEGNRLLLGQAVPREWLKPGLRIGIERAQTHFGAVTLLYEPDEEGITAHLQGPKRNPPSLILLRFRPPDGRRIETVIVNGKKWSDYDEKWIRLPGDIEEGIIRVTYNRKSH